MCYNSSTYDIIHQKIHVCYPQTIWFQQHYDLMVVKFIKNHITVNGFKRGMYSPIMVMVMPKHVAVKSLLYCIL